MRYAWGVHARRAIPLILAAMAIVLSSGSTAVADDWSDAKKAFKRAQRSDDWKTRAAGYGELAFFDGTKAVEEILKQLGKEKNEAVGLAAVKAMQAFVTDGAKEQLQKELVKQKDGRKLLVMLTLEAMEGNHGNSYLMELLQSDKDLQLKCQAALVLGRRQVKAAAGFFMDMLFHKDWHVRAAGARALDLLAGKVPDKPQDPKAKPKPFPPEWYPTKNAMTALVDALDVAEGSERRAIIAALERVGKAKLGWDPPAWRQLIGGTAVDKITKNPKHPPYFFGVPVWGKRIAIVMTLNHRLSEPHNYPDRTRLQELCEVPGARSVAWPRMKSNGHFISKHLQRTVKDLPADTKFNLFLMGQKVDSLFPRLTGANSSNKNKVITWLEEFKTDAGNDMYSGLNAALDVSGKKDTAAWGKGPDEVLVVTCAVPWLAEITDQQVIGSAVGLKARRRMVPIVAVGVHEHPYALMELLGELTGGVYLSLER